MLGIRFGDYHTYEDLNLILTDIEEIPPGAKLYEVDIDGRNGKLDLTEALGDLKYENRQGEYQFAIKNSSSNAAYTLDILHNYINGQKLKIIRDWDADYYFYGRLLVQDIGELFEPLGLTAIEYDADPYKYKLSETAVELTLTAETAVTLSNEQMPAIPTIVTDGEITITYGDSTLVLSEGEWIATDLTLSAGETEWTITPTDSATVTITYQEGRL